jgi:hypothetical protein
MKNAYLSALGLLVLGVLGSPQLRAQSYTAYPVDTSIAVTAAPGDRPFSSLRMYEGCYAMNADGSVLCRFEESGVDYADTARSWFQYTNPLNAIAPFAITDPSSRSSATSPRASITAVNRGSLFSGGVDDLAGTLGGPVLFKADRTIIRLSDTPGIASDVNDRGWVVGFLDSRGSRSAFIWTPNAESFTTGVGVTPAPGSIRTLPCERDLGRALHINRNGWIAGGCNAKATVWSAWDLSRNYDLDAPGASWFPDRVDLGAGLVPRTPSTFSSCVVADIAEEGNYIAVNCSSPDYSSFRQSTAFVNTPSSPFRLQQVLAPLSSGSDMNLRSINSSGCAVGTSSAAVDPRDNTVVLYCNGVTTSLTRAIPGYSVFDAFSINESGMILVLASPTDAGAPAYFVLVPGKGTMSLKGSAAPSLLSRAFEKVASVFSALFGTEKTNKPH